MVDSEATVRVLVHKGGVACFGKQGGIRSMDSTGGVLSFARVREW